MSTTLLPEETLNSKDNLSQFLLNNGISKDAVDILKDEGVDGYAFMELTEIDLKELNIKIGPRKRILNLINNYNNVKVVFVQNEAHSNVDIQSVKEKNNINSSTECTNVIVLDKNKEHQSSNEFSLQVFDIKSWIKENDNESKKKPSLFSILESGVLKPVDRQELIRICCAGLIKLNNNSLYPSNTLKTELARQIVTQFPKLRSTLSENGYEHFYDSKTNQGFIEYRLKTMRRHLSPSKKRRVASTESKLKKLKMIRGILQNNYMDEDLFKLKIAELALKMPNSTNKDDIFKLSDETRCNRQKQVKDSNEELTLSDILQIYPRFKDYNGELIHREFLAEFPDNDTFLARFVSLYVPRILQYCSLNAPDLLYFVNDIEDNLKALILLPHLLPSPNYTKRKINSKEIAQPNKDKQYINVGHLNVISKVTIPHKSLLTFKKAQDNLYVSECLQTDKKNKKNVQPYLICSMTNEERKGIFYIKADDHLIEIGNNGLQAFDILLKLHYCFNVHFAADLVNFYDFITGCVLNLVQPKACSVAFDITLKNLSTYTNVAQDE